jgi:hypothetical protein
MALTSTHATGKPPRRPDTAIREEFTHPPPAARMSAKVMY